MDSSPNRCSLQAFGVTIGLECSQPSILPDLVVSLGPQFAQTSPCSTDSTYTIQAHPSYFTLIRDGRVLCGTPLQARLPGLLLDILIPDLAARATNYLFVHAGAVQIGDKAMVFPGVSGSGKSTLVQHFLDAGANYLSDEVAVIDHRGRVHPFPTRLRLRHGDIRERQIPIETTVQRPLPLGWLIFTHFEVDKSLRPRSVSPTNASLRLFPHILMQREFGPKDIDLLESAVSQGSAWESARGDCRDAVPELLKLAAKFPEIERIGK